MQLRDRITNNIIDVVGETKIFFITINGSKIRKDKCADGTNVNMFRIKYEIIK